MHTADWAAANARIIPAAARAAAVWRSLGLAGCICVTASAGDWPQWGGRPERNMYSPETGLPSAFDPGKPKPNTEEYDLAQAKNTRWVIKLGSQTYGNVTVAEGCVFVGTNNELPRDPRHTGDRSILLCLDEATGDRRWQLVVPKLAAGRVNDWEYLGILSSPAVERGRVYVVTSRCEVMCLDLHGQANGNQGPFTNEALYVVKDLQLDKHKPTERPVPPIPPGPKDADILWVYDLMDELGVFPHNAANCSPLVVGDRVYAGTANGHDWSHANVPAPFAPSLVALHKQTGELLGQDDAEIGPRVFHSQWSSPASGVVRGRPLVFFGAGDGVLYAFDAEPVKPGAAAQLKKVWWFDCNPPEYKFKDGKPIKYPDAAGPSEINATPVFYRDRVYVAIGQDPEQGEGVGRLVCVNATGTGDVTGTGLVWDFRVLQRSLSTVSIDPQSGLLFVADFSGFLHCLDAETGKLHWTHDLKAHVWGSTLVADGKVFVGDEDGDFVVLTAGKTKQVLSEVNLGAAIYSAPVVANGVLYVSTQTHLFAFHAAGRVGAR